MDIGKAFTFVFDDENWLVKVLIGGVLGLIPIVNFALFGYMVETIRGVALGVEKPLPEWSDFGGKFVKGLMVLVIGFIYTIPIWLIMGCFWTAALAVGEGNQENIITLLSTGMGCLSGLYGLILAILSPAILVNYAVTGEIGSAFRIGELFGFITGNLGNYIVAILLSWLAGLIAGLAEAYYQPLAFRRGRGWGFGLFSYNRCLGWGRLQLIAADIVTA